MKKNILIYIIMIVFSVAGTNAIARTYSEGDEGLDHGSGRNSNKEFTCIDWLISRGFKQENIRACNNEEASGTQALTASTTFGNYEHRFCGKKKLGEVLLDTAVCLNNYPGRLEFGDGRMTTFERASGPSRKNQKFRFQVHTCGLFSGSGVYRVEDSDFSGARIDYCVSHLKYADGSLRFEPFTKSSDHGGYKSGWGIYGTREIDQREISDLISDVGAHGIYLSRRVYALRINPGDRIHGNEECDDGYCKNETVNQKICGYLAQEPWVTGNPTKLIGCLDDLPGPAPPIYGILYSGSSTAPLNIKAVEGTFYSPVVKLKGGSEVITLNISSPEHHKCLWDANSDNSNFVKFSNADGKYCAQIDPSAVSQVCVCKEGECNNGEFIACAYRPIPDKIVAQYSEGPSPSDNSYRSVGLKALFLPANTTIEGAYNPEVPPIFEYNITQHDNKYEFLKDRQSVYGIEFETMVPQLEIGGMAKRVAIENSCQSAQSCPCDKLDFETRHFALLADAQPSAGLLSPLERSNFMYAPLLRNNNSESIRYANNLLCKDTLLKHHRIDASGGCTQSAGEAYSMICPGPYNSSVGGDKICLDIKTTSWPALQKAVLDGRYDLCTTIPVQEPCPQCPDWGLEPPVATINDVTHCGVGAVKDNAIALYMAHCTRSQFITWMKSADNSYTIKGCGYTLEEPYIRAHHNHNVWETYCHPCTSNADCVPEGFEIHGKKNKKYNSNFRCIDKDDNTDEHSIGPGYCHTNWLEAQGCARVCNTPDIRN